MFSLFSYILLKKRWIPYLFCCCFLLYETVLQISFACIAPQFLQELGLNKQTLSVLSASYFVSYALLQVVMAHFLNRFSFRRVFIFSLLMLVLSTYYCSVCTSLMQACLARFMMGASSCSAFILLVSATKTAFKKKLSHSLSRV